MDEQPFVLHRLRQPESWFRGAKTVSLLAGLDGVRVVETGRCAERPRGRHRLPALRALVEPEVRANEAVLDEGWRPPPSQPFPVAGAALARVPMRLCRLTPVAWRPGDGTLTLLEAARGRRVALDTAWWEVPAARVEGWLHDVAWLGSASCPLCARVDTRTARADKLRFPQIVCADCRRSLGSAHDGERDRALALVAAGPDEPCALRYRDTNAPYALRDGALGDLLARIGERRVRVHEGRFGSVIVRLDDAASTATPPSPDRG